MDFNRYSIPLVEEHIYIRETIGYDKLKDIDLQDIPEVLNFLHIVWNYCNMKDKLNEEL